MNGPSRAGCLTYDVHFVIRHTFVCVPIWQCSSLLCDTTSIKHHLASCPHAKYIQGASHPIHYIGKWLGTSTYTLYRCMCVGHYFGLDLKTRLQLYFTNRGLMTHSVRKLNFKNLKMSQSSASSGYRPVPPFCTVTVQEFQYWMYFCYLTIEYVAVTDCCSITSHRNFKNQILNSTRYTGCCFDSHKMSKWNVVFIIACVRFV